MHLYSSAPLDSEGNRLLHCIFLFFTAKHTSYSQGEGCNNQAIKIIKQCVCHLVIFNVLLLEQFVLTCPFRVVFGVERTKQKQSIVTATQNKPIRWNTSVIKSSLSCSIPTVAGRTHIRIILAPLLLQHIWSFSLNTLDSRKKRHPACHKAPGEPPYFCFWILAQLHTGRWHTWRRRKRRRLWWWRGI